MRERGSPKPPIPIDELPGIIESHRDALSGWLLVPPEWLEFIDDIPYKVAPPNEDAVRDGLECVRRFLDEEGWALGHRGWIVMKHLEIMGRDFRKVSGN